MKYGKKKRNDPRFIRLPIALILGAGTVLLGAALAILSLATQSVKEVTKMPEADQIEPGVVYFLKGSDAGGDAWESRLARFSNSGQGEVRLSEGDLNQWSQSELRPEVRPQPAATPGTLGNVEIPEVRFNVSPPNFRIADGELQASVYISSPKFNRGRKYLYQMRGSFGKGDDGTLRFNIREGHFGKAPLGHIPYINEYITDAVVRYFEPFKAFESASEPWKRIRDVRIEGDELVINFGS